MQKNYLLLCLALLLSTTINAHTIDFVVDEIPTDEIIWQFLREGFEHIVPLGLDHILFILALFFLNNDWKSLLKQATCFTLAHSITLGLAMNGLVFIPSKIIEPLIALSIAFLAAENLRSHRYTAIRYPIIFLFGLVHGMGFAGALSEVGLPSYAFVQALVAFNIGVELGQITVILLAYILCAYFLQKQHVYRKYIVIPSSVGIGMIAIYWTIERII